MGKIRADGNKDGSVEEDRGVGMPALYLSMISSSLTFLVFSDIVSQGFYIVKDVRELSDHCSGTFVSGFTGHVVKLSIVQLPCLPLTQCFMEHPKVTECIWSNFSVHAGPGTPTPNS